MALSLALSIVSLLALFRVATKQAEANQVTETRFQSYLLADELRQSSDDLTRLARTYVVTGDASYEQQYMDILDIRNGKKPRPEHYERIYWDFVAAGMPVPASTGPSVPLAELMRKAGFSEQEFAKLQEAQTNSDGLVKTEVIAMNAVKGLFDDGSGNFTKKGPPDLEMARTIMHDAQYHRNKGKIMQPVNEFLTLLDQRTSAAVQTATGGTMAAYSVTVGVLLVSVMVSLLCLFLVYRHIKRNLDQAIATAQLIAGGDLSIDAVIERADEIGVLLHAMNTINANLTGLIGDIRSSTGEMSVATHEIALGNADLSARTEAQASSLEETASSMETLTATVRQNASNAGEANQLAATASAVAVQGGAHHGAGGGIDPEGGRHHERDHQRQPRAKRGDQRGQPGGHADGQHHATERRPGRAGGGRCRKPAGTGASPDRGRRHLPPERQRAGHGRPGPALTCSQSVHFRKNLHIP